MKQRRYKLVPDRIFHKIWDDCHKESISTIYERYAYNVRYYENYHINLSDWLKCLDNIYNAAQMTFMDFRQANDLTNAQISHLFCIPIRTVEDWSTSRREPPTYIMLMLLRKFQLLKLGDYIILESEDKGRWIPPQKKELSVEEDDDIMWYREHLSSIDDVLNVTSSIKTRNILQETSYLDKFIKR